MLVRNKPSCWLFGWLLLVRVGPSISSTRTFQSRTVTVLDFDALAREGAAAIRDDITPVFDISGLEMA